IAKEIIDRLLSEERTETAEEILAEKLCQKRLVRLKNLSPKEKKEKLFGLLSRRGFSSQTAIGVIDKLIKKE
ncbi:MAG: RecX family transcriptional regulator, partial [bacterium]|nr:RecX family transcriptional regulator [bacterium]